MCIKQDDDFKNILLVYIDGKLINKHFLNK